MDKQGLDYPVCPYCGTKTNMTTEIENMRCANEIEVLCQHCGMLYSIQAFYFITYDCRKIYGLK